jgi:hypothetical protein
VRDGDDPIDFRGPGELLAWLGILPVRGSGRTRDQAAYEAEAALRRLGPWRWRRGFRVPAEVLEGVRGELAAGPPRGASHQRLAGERRHS